MKKSCILWLGLMLPFLVCFSPGIAADRPEEKFSEGNGYYENGEYEKAAECYEQIIRDYELSNSALFYNMGNACMKMNRLGPAIYYYHKALKLKENDPDIRENLQYAEHLRQDRIKKPEESIYSRAFMKFQGLLSINQGVILSLAFYVLLNVLLFFRILGRPLFAAVLNRYLTGAVLLLILIFVSSTGLKIYHKQHYREAVLLAPSIDVKSGPGEDNTTLFTVHEGLKVRIRAERGEWNQIRLENGLSGWARKKEMGVI